MTPRSNLSRRALLPVAAALLLAGPLLPLAYARTGSYQVTARSGLNVRSGPGGGYRTLGALPPGAKVTTLAERGSWRKIRYKGREAWVHKKYLKPASARRDDDEPASTGRNTSGQGGNFVDTLEGRNGRNRSGHETDGSGSRSGRGGGSGDDASGSDRGGDTGTAGNGRGSGNDTASATPRNLPRSRAGFVQLPASGPGFVTYKPSNRRWGTTTMVYGLMRIGQRWAGQGPRMQVGDISFQNGGRMDGHVSHQRGVDVDVRPVSKSGEGPVVWQSSNYSRTSTTRLQALFRQNLPVALMLFNDPRAPGVRKWPNHDNHFHVRTSR